MGLEQAAVHSVSEGSRNLSRIAIVRHGEYGSDSKLNERGRQQIQGLGEKLKETIGAEELALILSSTAARALESAEILANILGVSVAAHEVLWSENRHPEDFEAAYALVNSIRSRADVAILITHLEYTEGFPWFLGEKDLGVHFPYRCDVRKGEGIIIDYRSKCLVPIRR